MQITAAADGSSLGNPGPAGWAWVTPDGAWRSGGWKRGTNNMGELMAVLDLLEQTAASDAELRILCDSQYVINSVTKWMPGWKRKGWKKSDGKPVQNRDLLERIDAALAGRNVEFEWVKGHAGHDLNEQADARARAAAEAYQRGREPEVGPGFGDALPSSAAPRAESRDDEAVLDEPVLDAPALFDDALFDDEDFAVDAGLEASGVDAEVIAALAAREADGARAHRHDAFEQVGRAATGSVESARVELIAPGVALVRSLVDGAERTSVWVRDAARHDAEWLLRLRHDG